MEENKIYKLIEQYLTGRITDEEKQKFISKMKADVELMKQVEIERGIAEILINESRDKLKNRFLTRYTEQQAARHEIGINEFTAKTDDKLIEYMNAAYIKNIDLFANDSDVLNLETLLKFLEGEKGKEDPN